LNGCLFELLVEGIGTAVVYLAIKLTEFVFAGMIPLGFNLIGETYPRSAGSYDDYYLNYPPFAAPLGALCYF
jgi:hypothetical protein